MARNIEFLVLDNSNAEGIELIERKGIGHPDTLADALAEELSRGYSEYTLKEFGAVLHHNFDKVGCLGGSSFVRFGEGHMINPIQILINGRASTSFGSKFIPVNDILKKITLDFFKKMFPMLDVEKDVEIKFRISTASSPGRTEENESNNGTRKFWFAPRGLHDLGEMIRLHSNDTSLGCGYAPFSIAEEMVLAIENLLNGADYKREHPEVGSDIKVMATKTNGDLDITMCVPQISRHVPNMASYKDNVARIKNDVRGKILEISDIYNIHLHLNTRDNYDLCEIYLTATGSSIESGDEGLVGRGNRINGLITPLKPMSMEGVCGKNPVYHVGKIYNIVARNIAIAVSSIVNEPVETILVSQSGRDLTDPWKIIVSLPQSYHTSQIRNIVETELDAIPSITAELIKGQVKLY